MDSIGGRVVRVWCGGGSVDTIGGRVVRVWCGGGSVDSIGGRVVRVWILQGCGRCGYYSWWWVGDVVVGVWILYVVRW